MRRIIPIILFSILSFTLSAQSLGDPVWKTYYDSAQVFWNKDWQKTIPLLIRAEKSALGDLGIYDANYLAILNDLGLSYAKTKDYKNAERILTRCLTIKKELKTPADPDIFQSMGNLAAIHAEQKHYREAEELYKSILSSAEPGTFTSIYWSTANNLELLYEDEGNLGAAQQLLDTLRAAHKTLGGSPVERYNMELSLGRIKRKLRKYEASKTILDPLAMALQDQAEPSLHSLYIESLQEVGVLYAETGAYSQAEKYFLEGLTLLKKQEPANHARLIEVLNNLAALYEKLGIYEKAIAYFQEALNLNSRFYGQNSLATTTLQSNIAGIHLKEGNMSEAISRYETISQSLLSQVTESSPFYITVLNNLATAYRRNNQIKEATETLEKANNLVEKYGLAGDDLGATIMNNMAVLLTAKGEPEKAIVYYEKAYAVKQKLYGDDSVLLLDLTGNMAVVYWALRQSDRALPLFQKSIRLSIKQINYIFPNLSEGEQIQFYKKLKEDFERFASIAFQSSAQHPDLLTQVFNNQITIKSLLFFSQQHKRDLVLEKRDSVLSQQYELLKSKRQQLGYLYQLSLKDLAQMEFTTTDLEGEIDKLEKAISLRTSETVAEKLQDNKIAWVDIKSKIRPDEGLIEVIRFRKYDVRTYQHENTEQVHFGFTDSIYYAALITTKETLQHPRLILFKEGRNMETRFLSYYRNALRFDYPDANSYQQYWQPLEAAVVDKPRIYFSGDGVYHQINLNTIQKPGSDEFLLQRYDIHYLLNPAQFLEREPTSFLGKKAVLLGDPAFSINATGKLSNRSVEAQKFAPLPGTNGEVVEINALLKKRNWSTTLLLQAQASEENLKRVQSPDILHIATHGFFSSDKVKLNLGAKNDFLFYSGLGLAGANANFVDSPVDAREDGILTAFEVMNLSLTNTHLVVLSACETGLGKIENGEGVYGLQRSFLQAGARNIVISLWKVDDEITKDLMVRFYQYLFQQKPEREALKLAQLDLLKKSRNPKGWGGFIVVGLD